MKITFLGKDAASAQGQCPSVYATDRGTYVIQGWKIVDSEALTELHARGLPDGETAVEIPANLFRLAPRSDA
ncbi:MAG: hypothetical protein H7Y15_08940 [Pseudonocardia sp.]|nr:hypothetical protein [Pseudonocardia sp.]